MDRPEYQEGRRAFWAHVKLLACPYDADTDARAHGWVRGWITEAQAFARFKFRLIKGYARHMT